MIRHNTMQHNLILRYVLRSHHLEVMIKSKWRQNLHLRCGLLSDPSAYGAVRPQPNHVSNPEPKKNDPHFIYLWFGQRAPKGDVRQRHGLPSLPRAGTPHPPLGHTTFRVHGHIFLFPLGRILNKGTTQYKKPTWVTLRPSEHTTRTHSNYDPPNIPPVPIATTTLRTYYPYLYFLFMRHFTSYCRRVLAYTCRKHVRMLLS